MKSVLVRQPPEYPASVSDVGRALLKFDELLSELGYADYDAFCAAIEEQHAKRIGLRHTQFLSDRITMRIEDAEGEAFYLHYRIKDRVFLFCEVDAEQDRPDVLAYTEVPYVGQLSLEVLNDAVSAEISYVRALLQE